MIRLETTIKATDNTQYNDPQLVLQTATAYFLIREIPSSTLPAFTTLPSFLDHPTSDQNSNAGIQGLSKSVLEYIFLALAVFIIILIIFRRFRGRHRRQQATFLPSASQRYRNFPRQVELQPLHAFGQDYPAHPDPFLREIPAAHIHPSQRTRARDIDSSGRRQDIPTEMDHDGDLGASDALPAYDYSGGPPKYFELDLLTRSRPPPPPETRSQRPDGSWENININPPENVGVHTPVDTTHATQVSQPSRPTPPYLEHTSSSSNDSLPMTRPRHETSLRD